MCRTVKVLIGACLDLDVGNGSETMGIVMAAESVVALATLSSLFSIMSLDRLSSVLGLKNKSNYNAPLIIHDLISHKFG